MTPTSIATRLRALVASPFEELPPDPNRSSYERFAIPYTFKPRLSLREATVAAFIAFLRIFLGSLLFGVWGSYTLFAWSKIGNIFVRVVAFIPLLTLFVFLFGALMISLSSLARFALRGKSAGSSF